VPGLYLAVILGSSAGVGRLAWRILGGLELGRLARTIGVVLVVFLGFDALGAARGWFASSDAWVVAIVEPGIPPEEVLLLGFLALFSVVLLEGFRRGWRRPTDA
jgi:hypothetical protein